MNRRWDKAKASACHRKWNLTRLKVSTNHKCKDWICRIKELSNSMKTEQGRSKVGKLNTWHSSSKCWEVHQKVRRKLQNTKIDLLSLGSKSTDSIWSFDKFQISMKSQSKEITSMRPNTMPWTSKWCCFKAHLTMETKMFNSLKKLLSLNPKTEGFKNLADLRKNMKRNSDKPMNKYSDWEVNWESNLKMRIF